ncbi:hypothetical protein H7K38_21675 [Mycobacterium alsense]|uniref:HNH endonuclease n=1 Tax=Mycobacterium alsense TaxID=324058 RepID=A0AA41XU51_9MYCO|nr:hypothetical protein [Mycobacterium alsense]MCV7381242.1 hypothetical protein [Mycobacterium alsense]
MARLIPGVAAMVATGSPPHLDHGQPRTDPYHHPERLTTNTDEDDDP